MAKVLRFSRALLLSSPPYCLDSNAPTQTKKVQRRAFPSPRAARDAKDGGFSSNAFLTTPGNGPGHNSPVPSRNRAVMSRWRWAGGRTGISPCAALWTPGSWTAKRRTWDAKEPGRECPGSFLIPTCTPPHFFFSVGETALMSAPLRVRVRKPDTTGETSPTCPGARGEEGPFRR